MITAIRTSLLCDTIPFPDSFRVRKGSATTVPGLPIESRSVEATLAIAMAGASPGMQLGTYTVIGSHVTTTLRDGEAVVSFLLDCNCSRQVHYPASQVVQTRTIGQCGGHDLVELTIAYW